MENRVILVISENNDTTYFTKEITLLQENIDALLER